MKSQTREWAREHSSAIFVLLLVVGSFAALALGLALNASQARGIQFLATTLLHFSGAALVAAVATLFFSFREVQDQLAGVVARLITTGSVVQLLSHPARDGLGNSLALARIGDDCSFLEPSLQHALLRISDYCLAAFHIYNFSEDVTLTPFPGNPDLLIHRSVRMFRVRSFHRSGSKRSFPLRYHMEVGLADTVQLSDDAFLREFDIRAGDRSFSRESVQIGRQSSGSLRMLTITFEEQVPVDPELDVRICVETLTVAADNNEMLVVRYPTSGFHVTLRFDESKRYDCVWFNAWNLGGGIKAGQEGHQLLHNGITAFSNDWLLPGDGVVFGWYTVGRADREPPFA